MQVIREGLRWSTRNNCSWTLPATMKTVSESCTSNQDIQFLSLRLTGQLVQPRESQEKQGEVTVHLGATWIKGSPYSQLWEVVTDCVTLPGKPGKPYFFHGNHAFFTDLSTHGSGVPLVSQCNQGLGSQAQRCADSQWPLGWRLLKATKFLGESVAVIIMDVCCQRQLNSQGEEWQPSLQL